jgi:2'-5' RNA ligase
VARTALIAAIRLPPGLAALRRRDVAVARLGVPPHVTILSPFLDSDRIDALADRAISRIASGVVGFDVAFRAVRRWPASAAGPGVVWLEPDPAAPFATLTSRLWARFPETPPYGEADAEIVPHLTIAIDEPSRFDAAEVIATATLPFRRGVRAIELVVEGPTGRWRRAGSYRLGVPGG